MKKTIFVSLFLIATILAKAQKTTERELVLECTSKMLIFQSSAKAIQTLYINNLTNSDDLRGSELKTMEKMLPHIEKSVSTLKTNYPTSAKNKTLATDFGAIKKILESLKAENWNTEEKAAQWQILLSLLGMDLEDLTLKKG